MKTSPESAGKTIVKEIKPLALAVGSTENNVG
jgi:hypothetical protein